LARLHIESLADKTTRRKIQDALKGLPRGTEALDKAYSGAMERIKNQMTGFRRLAERVLAWITYAQRALTSSELLHALAIIPGENFLDEDNLENIAELLSHCAGLVILDHESDRIRLVHYTAEEYLQTVRANRFPDGQVDISLTCLTYLSFQIFGEGECHGDASLENRLLSYPFLSYSAVYWSDHVRETSDKVILEMSARLLQDGPQVLSILQVKYSSLNRNSGHSSRFPRGLNPLHIAASIGLLQVSKILIARGVDTNGRDEEGRTPLLWAVDGGYDELVELLLENRANPQDEDRRGCRAIHYAARKGFLALVQSFGSARDDINRSDKRKQTPLHYAIINHQSPITKFLLTHGADANAVDLKRRSALHMAIQGRDIDLVRSLLSSKANPTTLDKEGGTPLHEAAKLGLYAAANPLLNYGAEVNAKNKMKRTPLHMAAMGGHEKIVEILIERGATLTDIDVNHWTALDWAIENGHVGSVSKLWELVEGPSNVESEPQKYLFRAAQKGDDAMIGYWLDQGAAINGVDGKDNRTALHYAAMRGRTSIIPTLLRRGSDVSSRDRNGSTPLFMAAQWWKRDTVSYLLTATRNDLTLTDNLGRTLLHWVVKWGWVEIVAKILDLGGRHDARDRQYRTPLHMAVIGNNVKLVEVLVQKGSSNAIQDLDGWLPSDWACWLDFKTLLGPLKVDYDAEKRNRLIIQRIEIGLTKVTHKLLDDDCLLHLARCALYLNTRDLATKIFADHGTQNPAWVCDICLKPRKHPMARSFCTICYDVDVCDICFLRPKSTRFCHAPSDFLRVVFSAANNEIGRERWVDELRKIVRDRQSS
jgi:ankyrin repeat protein